MNLRSGVRLGPYEIVAPTGAGGMGEVYKARDTRLGRAVAVKILPAEFADDARLKIRFEREAKTISALSHPHICTLHDVGHENGIDFLVMEWCEGQTLADRIAGGRLPVEQVLECGMQIAGALQKAHRAGIIHRDLKPSNIMLTKSGVKLLDFGLATHRTEDSGPSESSATQSSPSEEGHLVGTLRYMAPEVLKGSPADPRADLFSLGLVLYEMSTGQRAFDASSRAGIMAAILEREPPSVSELQPATPPALDRLIRACLVKDPDERVQTAHDVKMALQWIIDSSGLDPRRLRDERRRTRRRALVSGVLLLTIVGSAGLFLLQTRSEPPQDRTMTRSVIDLRGAAPVNLGLLMPMIGIFPTALAISHDGSVLVYVGAVGKETQLFLRQLEDFDVQPVPGTQGATFAFFSPDDAWIGFLTDDKLMKVPVAGGSPVLVGEVNQAMRAKWLANGDIAVANDEGSEVKLFPAGGGSQSMAVFFRRPARVSDILPDGKAVIVNLREKANADFSGCGIYDVKRQTIEKVITAGFDCRYAEPGVLLYVQGNDLRAIAFDRAKSAVVGQPVTLQPGVANASFGHQAQYAVSDTGVLAYVPGQNQSIGKVTWIDRNGDAEPLSMPERAYALFDLSPDDRRLVVNVSEATSQLFVFDLDRNEARRIPTPDPVGTPLWAPDGRHLVISFRAGDGKSNKIAVIDPARSGEPVVWHSAAIPTIPTSVSADRRLLTYYELVSDDVKVRIKRIGDEAPRDWFRNGCCGEFSPDGKWIAYVSRQNERHEIWAERVEDPSRSYQISVDGGVEPVWAHRSGELFFRKGQRWYAVKISTERELKWTPPRLVWETALIDTPGRSYDVTSDGKRLVISKPTSADLTDRIHLVQNWPALVRKAGAEDR